MHLKHNIFCVIDPFFNIILLNAFLFIHLFIYIFRVNSEAFLLGSFATKSTPILCLSFTRRNLLLGAGMYHG